MVDREAAVRPILGCQNSKLVHDWLYYVRVIFRGIRCSLKGARYFLDLERNL